MKRGVTNWKDIASADLRRIARDRFGEALKIACLSDEEIAEEMEAYDRLVEHKRKHGDEPLKIWEDL